MVILSTKMKAARKTRYLKEQQGMDNIWEEMALKTLTDT